jgi:hypothetical protein
MIDTTDESNLDYLQTENGIREFAVQNGFLESFRVSAKEDINVSTAFANLTREMIIAELAHQQQQNDEQDFTAERERTRSITLNSRNNVAGARV